MYGKVNRTGELKCQDPSLTKQSMMDECDINMIMKRAERAGLSTRLDQYAPDVQFGDVSEVGDFGKAQERILAGERIFAALTADDRDRFRNDPARFFEWAQAPENEEAVYEMRFGKEALERLKAARADGLRAREMAAAKVASSAEPASAGGREPGLPDGDQVSQAKGKA